ncbi:AAA domain-containing protein [Candidatus Harpocratesius sp.]
MEKKSSSHKNQSSSSVIDLQIIDKRSKSEIEKEIENSIKIPKTFSKNSLKRLIEVNCLRQTFLYLPNSPLWRNPVEKPEPRIPKRAGSEFSMKQGHEYEQKIYSHLSTLPFCLCIKSKVNKMILNRNITPELFKNLYFLAQKNNLDEFIILEGEFDTGEEFFEKIFSPKHPQDPLPIKYSKFRPDIITIQRIISQKNQSSTILALNELGLQKTISINQNSPLFKISIIDIKHISENNIGKPHFIEILYYMHAMAWYIHSHALDDMYFVSLEDNGILPLIDDNLIVQINNIEHINLNLVKVEWKNLSRLYKNAINAFKELWKKAPCNINSIPLNIQPHCGSCQFLNDCIKRLGVINGNPPKNWSLELIPYTNPSVIMQMKEYGLKTIGDVANKLQSIPIGTTPQPLYAEMPFLQNRAKAIIQQSPIYPSTGRIYSYAIPKYSSMNLIFTIESDPLNERVFGIGLRLEMMIAKKSKNYPLFHQWWKIWKESLTKNINPDKILQELQKNNPFYNKFPLKAIESLHYIIKNIIPLEITLEGQPRPGKKPYQRTKVNYEYNIVNQSLKDPNDELIMLLKIIDKLIAIIEICTIIENYLVYEYRVIIKKKNFFRKIRLHLSIYYWAQDQIENMRDLMERNLDKLLNSSGYHQKLLKIIQFFTPAESEVSHPYQHNKLYDLLKFVESVIGFPSLINYTWHEIGKEIFNTKFKQKFWITHFNYMDYQVWYEFLETEDPTLKKEREEEIKYQLSRKTKIINLIRKKFQVEATESIPLESNPVSLDSFSQVLVPQSFHKIAHLWYFFARLTGAIDELEKEEIRTMFPEYSIGKLNAAEVQNLKFIQTNPQKDSYYIFEIRDLSSNMKLKEKDRILLIPDEMRDKKIGNWIYNWKFSIERLIWNSKINGFIIKTYPHNVDLFKNYQAFVSKPKSEPIWYIFPLPLDVWSNKLYKGNGNGLLEKHHFGDSWLGSLLAYLWGIDSQTNISFPSSWKFQLPEIYLFYPKILSTLPFEPKSYKPITKGKFPNLLSKAYPKPDLSQKEAICLALNSYIHAIQGPPGTGKSQTITTLIDEYICRIKQKFGKNIPIKILITAFSYAAIRVLIDKIRLSKDQLGNQTQAASMQLIFLHSEMIEPIEDIPGLPHIDDLTHKSGGGWLWNGQKRIITKKKPLQNVLKDKFILFGNAHQLYHIPTCTIPQISFDLIIVDEASQVPTDHFLASLQFVHPSILSISPISSLNSIKNVPLQYSDDEIEEINSNEITQIVIVGDYFQLPPVQPVEPPKKVEQILGSLYSYYVRHHGISQTQLQINYRSHPDIVEFTRQLSLYQNLKAHFKAIKLSLSGKLPSSSPKWIEEVFKPERVVCTIIHEYDFEIAISPIEAFLISKIVLYYWKSLNIKTVDEERKFWLESVGVVSPHNAQGRQILRQVFLEMTDKKHRLTLLSDEELMRCLQATIYSVEKFQGSDRDMIIASVGISDKDHLKKEEEFIYDLNRFNVLTSRAKRKLIYICSRAFLEYIPHDKLLINYAAQTYKYAFEFCNQEKTLFFKNHLGYQDFFYFRWHEYQNSLPKEVNPFSTFYYDIEFIKQKKLSITATSQKFFLDIIKSIPTKQVSKIFLDNGKKIKIEMDINNPKRIAKILPIPQKFHYIFFNSTLNSKTKNISANKIKKTLADNKSTTIANNKKNLPTNKVSSKIKLKKSEKKSEKIKKKLPEKKLSIKLHDTDDDLF